MARSDEPSGQHRSAVPQPQGGLGALASAGPHGLWSVGLRFQQYYTGRVCAAARVAVRTIPLRGVGMQPTGMYPTRDAPGALLVASAQGRVFVRDQNGAVAMLDTTRARVIHQAALDASGPLALDARRGRVFVPSTRGGGSVLVLDAATGQVTRSFPAGASPAAVAVDARSGRLIVAEAADVRIFDAARGRTLTTVPFPHAATLALESGQGHIVVLAGMGLGLPTAPIPLIMLDAARGAVVTTFRARGWPLAVAAGAGRLYVATGDRTNTFRLSVLDAATGAVLRTVTLGHDGDAYVSTLLADPTRAQVFIASFFGLQVLDTATGALRTLERQAPSAIAFDARRERLYGAYLNTTNQYGSPLSFGSVAIFTTPTGARVAMVTVGSGPDSIAVDPVSGQAFVLTQRGVDVLDVQPASPRGP